MLLLQLVRGSSNNANRCVRYRTLSIDRNKCCSVSIARADAIAQRVQSPAARQHKVELAVPDKSEFPTSREAICQRSTTRLVVIELAVFDTSKSPKASQGDRDKKDLVSASD